MNRADHPVKIGSRVGRKSGTIQFLELRQIVFQSGDFLDPPRSGIVFHLRVVLMEAVLRGLRRTMLEIEIEILLHQRVEIRSRVGRRSRGGGEKNQSGQKDLEDGSHGPPVQNRITKLKSNPC